MKNLRFIIFTFTLFLLSFATAQTRGVANNAIPGDNTMRYYRLALPVTLSAFQQDLESDYNKVQQFWQECEDFANRMFVPLGICFDVVEDARLVMPSYNLIDENIYNTNSFGTELTNEAIGAASYDVGMWVHHRDEFAENSGLSVGNGAYNASTKSSGYAKTDKWVVAHELGHMFGADFHTAQGEGSLMDNEGEYFSYPSLLLIREESVKNGVGSANVNKNVTNSAPQFTSAMKDTYRIPQGACVAIPLSATDAEGHLLTYSAIGCSSTNVGNVNGENGVLPDFKSLIPQTSNIIDYSPKYSADINDASYYYEITGTNIPSMAAGSYSIAFLVNDMPSSTAYDYLLENPFYSNYAVWDANIEIVGSTTPFDASLSPAKNSYTAGETVTVKWGVNHSYFNTESCVRITMSADYGETFPYVLAESVPATDGICVVTLPNVNVGNVDVDFITAVRSMRGGIIRVEEIGGIAYTLTTLTPENGGGFNVTGAEVIKEYTISVKAEPATSGTATVNGVTSVTVKAASTVTLNAKANDGYAFAGWYLNNKQYSTEATCNTIARSNATYIAKFTAVTTPEPDPEPEQPMLYNGYYHMVNRDVSRHEYLYNNALSNGNNLCFTLQADAKVNTNNGIWYITLNDNKLGIKNGDGKAIVAGANGGGYVADKYTELTIEKITEDNGYTFYSFKEGLNCTKSDQTHFQKNGVNFVTTWAGNPDASDCQWRFEPVDMQGKSIYEILVECNPTDAVYVTYTNGTTIEYAYNGGFFITDGVIDATKLDVVGNNDAVVVVEGNTIKVVEGAEAPVKDILQDGAVYQILSAYYTYPQKGIYDNGADNAQTAALGTDVANSLWMVSKIAENCYSLRNCKTDRFLKGTTAQSGRWTMSATETNVYIYKTDDGHYYISAVELSDITKQSMSCAHNPSDHTNLVTWNNVNDSGTAISASLWNFSLYSLEEFSYTVTDEAGNEFVGTSFVIPGKDRKPVFTGVHGYELKNEVWNANNYTATITFPMPVSKKSETPNEILLAIYEDDRYLHAVGSDIKVQTTDVAKVDINCLWAVYPECENGRFRFAIRNISNGKYVYSASEDNQTITQTEGTVVLSDVPSKFEYFVGTDFKGFKFAGRTNLYLSINGKDDVDVLLGVHNAVHQGTDIFSSLPSSYGVAIDDVGYATFYAEKAVNIPNGVEAYYLTEDGINTSEGTVLMTKLENNVIPAGEAVVLKAEKAGTYTFNFNVTSTETIKNNLFEGTVAAEYITEESYVLAKPNDKEVGLYLADMNKENGMAFLNNGHRIYLPRALVLGTAALSSGFRFVFGATTIEDVISENEVPVIYDLQGRQLSEVTSSGIYIVNGKKVIFK